MRKEDIPVSEYRVVTINPSKKNELKEKLQKSVQSRGSSYWADQIKQSKRDLDEERFNLVINSIK